MSWAARTPLAVIVACTLGGTASFAQDLNGEQILRKVETDHRAKDERGVVDMVLVAEDGKKSRRSMESFFKQGEGDDDMTLLRFLSPPTVRGTSLLTREASERADDQWVYLPAFKKSKKIASNKRTNRFAGTDFTYEDLRTEDFSASTYKKLPDETIEWSNEKVPAFVVEAKPKNPDLSGYSKRVVYVEKKRFLTLKVLFYDHKDRHHKTLTNRNFEQVDGHWRAMRSMMEDHLRNSKTVWQVSERKINPGLAESLFTKRNLERGL